MNADGSNVETVVEHWEGKHLNSPNDIVARARRAALLHRPAVRGADVRPRRSFQGVFALDSLGEPRLLLDDFEKPNGLAFSPDEKTLYICDTGKYHVRAFHVELSGTVAEGSGRVFCTVDPAEKGGPDGMKVDEGGRVYVAVAEGVWVYEPDGKLLGILALEQRPSNLAWGGPDGQTLAITAVDHVYKVRFQVAGIIPPFRDSAATRLIAGTERRALDRWRPPVSATTVRARLTYHALERFVERFGVRAARGRPAPARGSPADPSARSEPEQRGGGRPGGASWADPGGDLPGALVPDRA